MCGETFEDFKSSFSGKKNIKSVANVDAIKLAECCISWFLIMFHKFKIIEGYKNRGEIIALPLYMKRQYHLLFWLQKNIHTGQKLWLAEGLP